ITKRNNSKKPDPISHNDNFIYINTYEDELSKEKNIVLQSYDEYKKYFDTKILEEKDFKSNNYVIVPISFDSCSDENIVPTDYKIDNNNITINISYTATCGVCKASYIYYLLKVDKELKEVNLSLNYKQRNTIKCNTDISYKPIIYLYPTSTINITIKFNKPENLITTYPKYIDKWEVSAEPNGKLIDIKTNRELYSLYWEGNNHQGTITNEGFIVKGEDTIPFLESHLKYLGLTEREADEFIIYWLPKLESNKYNYIHFETTEEINSYMPLDISPLPDTIIRINMNYKPLEEPIEVKEQILSTPKREGFTLVEWGGSLIE
ncbi:MAG TPA: hypothetical protein DCE23_03040, partial [Firmicutes bacterium]|nr:hypothetical protein [Bacillota bacterium]